MKTWKGLYGKVCSFENLALAAARAQKGKRFRPAVCRFNFKLEGELCRLRRELLERTYAPGAPRTFVVHESKRRLISAAPYRDRVVHHALCNVIEPIFERSFIHDSYANRKGKGTHKAILRFSEFCRKSRYVLRCDIREYFPSIDRRKLLDVVARKVADEGVLWLAGRILGLAEGDMAGRVRIGDGPPAAAASMGASVCLGLPIGNLTSQFFANLYLDGFDHFVKETLRCGRYLRYVDDFAVLGDDKRLLAGARDAMSGYLSGLGLALHPRKTAIFPAEQGCDFLGFKIFPEHRLLSRGNFFHFRRKFKAAARACRLGRADFAEALASARSWIAHARWGDTWGLRAGLFAEPVL